MTTLKNMSIVHAYKKALQLVLCYLLYITRYIWSSNLVLICTTTTLVPSFSCFKYVYIFVTLCMTLASIFKWTAAYKNVLSLLIKILDEYVTIFMTYYIYDYATMLPGNICQTFLYATMTVAMIYFQYSHIYLQIRYLQIRFFLLKSWFWMIGELV